MSQREDASFVKTLTAAQLKSVFTVDEQGHVMGAVRFLLENVVFLFPMHENALAISLEHRDSFTTALLNVVDRIGVFHVLIRKLLSVPSDLFCEGDVLNGLIRLYVFQHGVDFCKTLFAEVLGPVAVSTEDLSSPIRDDAERDKVRAAKLDGLVKVFLAVLGSPKAVSSMPRGLRVLAFVVGEAGGIGEVKRLLLERFFIPIMCAASEFGVVESGVTPQGRATLVAVARALQLLSRGTHDLLEKFAKDAMAGDWSTELSPALARMDLEDTDISFFVATASACCERASARLRDSCVQVSEFQESQFEKEVREPLCAAAREWERRNRVSKALAGEIASQTDEMLSGLDALLAARLRKDVHECVANVKSKLEELRTFQLLGRTKLKKRAHPTQWHIHGGVLSDLLKGLSSLGTVYAEVRFALKAAVPILANAQLDEDKLAELLAVLERSNGRDLVEQLVKGLGGAAELVSGLHLCKPSADHSDAAAFGTSIAALERELELVERGEIESLLRCYKFQKYAVSGWKLMPKSLTGGSRGICSVLRRHLIAGLVLHGVPKPARFFAQLFSDCLVLLSQIELTAPESGDLSPRSSPRVQRVRSGSLANRVSGKEKKRVLMRMGSETTMQLLQQRKLISPRQTSKAPVLFRIEKVITLGDIVVELQLLNKGFSVDGFEFTVEGGRELLLRWFEALRSCECGKLIDTATTAADAMRSSSAIASSEDSPADEDLARMMDEFEVYSGGSMVVRGGSMVVRTEQDDGMVHVLDQIDKGTAAQTSENQATITNLMALFVPPSNIQPVQEKKQPDEQEEEEAASLARMLKSSKFTLRLLRE